MHLEHRLMITTSQKPRRIAAVPVKPDGMTPDGYSRIALLGARRTSQADGIQDYTTQLLVALNEVDGITARLFDRRVGVLPHCFAAMGSNDDLPTFAEAVVLQYNPFWYANWGFAPGLVAAVARLRRSNPQLAVGLMVHENYVEPKSWRWALMSGWQLIQLRLLQRLSDVQFCSIAAWTDDLRAAAPDTPTHHLPVASNFPDRRERRCQARADLGMSDGQLVLCAFGLHHYGRLHDQMIAAARAVRDTGCDVLLLNLGVSDAPRHQEVSGVRILSPGYLPADRAAEAMAASDIFMAAFDDGVSTRRTTLMTALQQQVAVVGTAGHLTDPLLRTSTDALRLVPVHAPEQFASAVLALARDSSARHELALRGRRLYESHFSWPIIASRLLDGLREARR